MPDPHPRVHNRLPVLRAERGWSRRDLAARLDLNHQTIGFIERGDYNPSLELALRIARLFALPVEAIFSLAPMAPLSAEVYRDRPPHAAPDLRVDPARQPRGDDERVAR